MPIPQKKTISLDIILHRLPFVFKMYYLETYNSTNHTDDIRNSMNLLRKKSIDQYRHDEPFENDIKIYSNKSSTSIPIKVVIEIDRKNKIYTLIDVLKEIKELELETESKFTDFVVMTIEGNFIDKNLNIDECFQPFQTISVYELLNTNGIFKYFTNSDINLLTKSENSLFNAPYDNNIVYSLNTDVCVNFTKPIYLDKMISNLKTEYLIQITHRYTIEAKEFLFRRQNFQRTDHLYSIILVNNKVNINNF
jgi:hypothetical protein